MNSYENSCSEKGFMCNGTPERRPRRGTNINNCSRADVTTPERRPRRGTNINNCSRADVTTPERHPRRGTNINNCSRVNVIIPLQVIPVGER